MRLWTIHPEHLDPKGLVALWREALLAQAVLAEQTRGYRHHPELDRFKAQRDPMAFIATYLRDVAREASRRGYAFDQSKIGPDRTRRKIVVTREQVEFEWKHLAAKLRARNFEWHQRMPAEPNLHPLFVVT